MAPPQVRSGLLSHRGSIAGRRNAQTAAATENAHQVMLTLRFTLRLMVERERNSRGERETGERESERERELRELRES